MQCEAGGVPQRPQGSREARRRSFGANGKSRRQGPTIGRQRQIIPFSLEKERRTTVSDHPNVFAASRKLAAGGLGDRKTRQWRRRDEGRMLRRCEASSYGVFGPTSNGECRGRNRKAPQDGLPRGLGSAISDQHCRACEVESRYIMQRPESRCRCTPSGGRQVTSALRSGFERGSAGCGGRAA